MKYTFYKIVNKNNSEMFYIGSTIKFSSRKSNHKKNVNNKVGKKYWCKLYQYIRANGNWVNFDMLIIYEDEYETKKAALQYEQQLINDLKPLLNSIAASKTI